MCKLVSGHARVVKKDMRLSCLQNRFSTRYHDMFGMKPAHNLDRMPLPDCPLNYSSLSSAVSLPKIFHIRNLRVRFLLRIPNRRCAYRDWPAELESGLRVELRRA